MKELKSTEEDLIMIAEADECDNKSREAMKMLRKHYDKTYFFCSDCDGLVVKEKDCCLNEVIEREYVSWD